MGIKHKAVKASRETGLASEWNDNHEIDGDVECEQHQHKEHVIENRTTFPGGPVEGQVIYRSDLNIAYVWNGSEWQPMSLPEVKEFFVLAPGNTDWYGEYAAKQLNTASNLYFSFMIPGDFVSFESVEIIFISGNTRVDVDVRCYGNWSEVGENVVINSVDSGVIQISFTAAEMSSWDITTYLENPGVGFAVAADDIVGVRLRNNTGVALQVIGIRVRYR